MLKFIRKLSLLSILLLLVSCYSSRHPYQGDTTSLAGLQAMSSTAAIKSSKKQKISKFREMALQEIALSLGAQAGLAARATVINKALNQQSRNLDAVYDFNALVLQHNILPPVLLEGRNTFNQSNDQTIRISDRAYKLAKQARFITSVPNWRQYLWMDYKKPDEPNAYLLPKTKNERRIWCAFVSKGWKNGIEQANTILEESVARLKEDYSGMILYRKLLAMNMVSAPYVSHTDLGITGDDSEMHIDDRVLRITALPALNVNSEEWRAAVTKDETALEQFKNMEKMAQDTKITITSKAWQPVIAPVN